MVPRHPFLSPHVAHGAFLVQNRAAAVATGEWQREVRRCTSPTLTLAHAPANHVSRRNVYARPAELWCLEAEHRAARIDSHAKATPSPAVSPNARVAKI